MKLVTVEEMRSLDARAVQEFGIPSLLLMENAGRAVAQKTIAYLGGCVRGNRILVFSGKGNNGGDGFVAARHLANAGADVKIFLLFPREEITGDAAVNLNILEKTGIPIAAAGPRDIQKIKIALIYADLVLDAVYGTGFKGKARGIAAEVITAINESRLPVIALDLPSGLEADTGRVDGPCIRANITCTLGLPKVGLYLYPGADFAGEIAVMDISLPGKLTDGDELPFHVLDRECCSPFFRPRDPDSHKGSFGHVFVAGGSVGMTGAVALAAGAALKGGAGLVTACIPSSLNAILENKLTEIMSIPLPENENRVLGPDAAGVIIKKAGSHGVIAAGPGLSTYPGTEGFISELLSKAKCPLVLDADGLNALAGNTSAFLNLNAAAIITPHPGEMGRLLGCSVKEVQQGRLHTALHAARQWGVVVVLKGARTITAAPDGTVFINPSGNPGLATAGSGDVLTGLIASFLAQGFPPVNAAAIGTYVHGLAADTLTASVGERGLTAGDVVRQLPSTILELEKLAIRGDRK